MKDDDESGSLADQAAAWVPPWQRPHATPVDASPAETPAASPGDDDDVWQQPETDSVSVPSVDSVAVGVAAEPGDEDDDWQQPETDFATVGVTAGPGDEDDDWQQPETDSLTVPAGGGGDDEDDWQQPETDVHADESGSRRPANLTAALEAILMVVDEPVAPDVLAEVLDVSIDEATAALEELSAQYTSDERGFDLRRAAGGWRLYTRGAYSSYVERFVLDGQSVRLTQAALETLAVIAYQQPVTRSRMSAIRGVNCDGVVRTLSNRGLIEECGASPDSGAFLYRTTPLFLEKLGLDSLDELPPLAPFLPDDVNGFIDA
jgi:segregation and condensation protein B